MSTQNYILFYGTLLGAIITTDLYVRYIALTSAFLIFLMNQFFFLNHWLECLIYTKRFFVGMKKSIWKTPDFDLKNATLCFSMEKKHDITNYFKRADIKKIDKDLFLDLIDNYGKYYIHNNSVEIYENARIKLEFIYKGQESIFFVSFKQLMLSSSQNKNIYEEGYIETIIPYPPYSEEIMERYRRNIVYPYYSQPSLNKKIYCLFGVDCKNIEYVSINGNRNFEKSEELERYVRKCQTPFYDFGLLYHCPVKLEWIIEDLGLENSKVERMEIKYMNYYFDEDKCELIEHRILLSHRKDILISDIKMDFLRAQKREENVELLFEY